MLTDWRQEWIDSPGSSIFMRRRRKRILSALVAALKHYADHELRTFTIMNANWLFSPKELEEITAAVINNGCQSARESGPRIGVQKGPLWVGARGIDPAGAELVGVAQQRPDRFPDGAECWIRRGS